MENWEKQVLLNVSAEYKSMVQEGEITLETFGGFFSAVPQVYFDSRYAYLNFYIADSQFQIQEEIILGFGDIGGIGAEFDGTLYWGAYFEGQSFYQGETRNGSPRYILEKCFAELALQHQKTQERENTNA